MKSVLVSTVLFSSLIVALPTQHSRRDALTQADIQLKTGDSDVDIGFQVPIGQLFPINDQNDPQAKEGVSAQVADHGVFCQAYSDNAGKVKLGGVFTDTITASFTDASTGDIGSSASSAVPIGAFCCVLSQDGFGVCGDSASSTSSSSTSSSTPTIRVQLDGADELAAQGEVPADGSVFLLSAHPPFFNDVISASIVDAEGLENPTCHAFSDAQGRIPVGGSRKGKGAVITRDDTDLSNGTGEAVTVVALRCKHA